jgi:hypothetical protein
MNNQETYPMKRLTVVTLLSASGGATSALSGRLQWLRANYRTEIQGVILGVRHRPGSDAVMGIQPT